MIVFFCLDITAVLIFIFFITNTIVGIIGQQLEARLDTILYKILPTLPVTNWNVLKYLCTFLYELSQHQSTASSPIKQPQSQQKTESEKKVLSSTHSSPRLKISVASPSSSSTFFSARSVSLPVPSPCSVSLPTPVANKNSPSASPSATPRSASSSQPPSPLLSPRYTPPSPSTPLLDLSIPHLAARFAPLIIKRKKLSEASELTPEELNRKQQRTVIVMETILNNQQRLFAERL